MQGSLKQTKDGRWSIRWRTPDGRQPRRTFTNRRAAERELRAQLVAIEERGHVGARRGLTVAGIIPEWWASTEHSVKPRSAERYDLSRRVIEERLGAVRLADLDFDTVQAFVNDLSREYAPRTVNSHYGVLQLILKDATARGLVRAIPRPKMPRVPRPVLTVPTADEVERLALESRADCFALVILAGYTGLREGELLGLHRRDVHLDREGGPRLWVQWARNKSTGKLESTKNEERRWVSLPRRAADVLAEHLAEYPGEMVFQLTGSTVQKSWDRARVQAGVTGVRFHDLRHAAASMMIASGSNPAQVANQLGHRDVTVTIRTYTHLWDSDIDVVARRMDDYLAAAQPRLVAV